MIGKDRAQNIIRKRMDEDNIYKINGQYVVTGKGDSWNKAKNEIEDLYSLWMESNEELGQSEAEVISRIEKSQIVKEEGEFLNYYFVDGKGIVGNPFTFRADDKKGYVDLLLLLMFMSSKVDDRTKGKMHKFVNTEFRIAQLGEI